MHISHLKCLQCITVTAAHKCFGYSRNSESDEYNYIENEELFVLATKDET